MEKNLKQFTWKRQWDTFVGRRVRYIQGLVSGLYNACMLCHKDFDYLDILRKTKLTHNIDNMLLIEHGDQEVGHMLDALLRHTCMKGWKIKS